MHSSRGLRVLLLLALAVPAIAAAQEPWKASYYPYLLKGPNDKTSLVLHYQYGQAADYEARFPFNASVSLEAGANADGSYTGIARFKAPGLAHGWRFQLETGVVRENRFGYFGLGNDTPEESPGEGQLTSRGGGPGSSRGATSPHHRGPAPLNVGVAFVNADFRILPGSSRFQGDHYFYPPCLPEVLCQPIEIDPGSSDFTGRVALVLDTRDSEFMTTRGVLVEGGAMFGTGGDGYNGYYGVARGFVPLWMGAVLGAG
jgi:hypothetical protein